jgi:hypothetical protein
MYDERGLRYVGLFLAGAGAAGLLIGVVGFFWPEVAAARAQWLAAGAAGLCLLFVLLGDTGLSWRERDVNLQVKLAAIAPQAPPQGDTESDESTDPDALETAWYTALRVFFRNGEAAGGFSHSKLVERGETMSEGDWTELTSFYASKDGGGVLRLDSRDGYVLNHGMTHDHIRQCIVRRSLPCPSGSPPEVVALPHDTTLHTARRRAATQA